MKITTGNFDPADNTVEVTFEYSGVKHTRKVNACLDEAGKYDPAATAERVEAVGNGVQRKIEIGVLTNVPPPAPAAE